MSETVRGADDWEFHWGERIEKNFATVSIRVAEIEILKKNYDYLKSVDKLLQGLWGIDFKFLMVPEKHTILRDFLPRNHLDFSKSPTSILDEYRDSEDEFYVPILERFKNERPESLYLRQDSHWTSQAALIAHETIFDIKLKIPISAKLSGYRLPWVEALGFVDEEAKSWSNAVSERCFFPRTLWSFRHLKSKKCSNGRRVCVFGNSFSEYYFLNILTFSFEEVFFCFSPGLDFSIISAIMPDVVIFQTSERFGDICISNASRDPFALWAAAASRPPNLVIGKRSTFAKFGRDIAILYQALTSPHELQQLFISSSYEMNCVEIGIIEACGLIYNLDGIADRNEKYRSVHSSLARIEEALSTSQDNQASANSVP